jgi:hypothetical protein
MCDHKAAIFHDHMSAAMSKPLDLMCDHKDFIKQSVDHMSAAMRPLGFNDAC